jgi:hypothetical protein
LGASVHNPRCKADFGVKLLAHSAADC